ncbi:hypothetical protein CWI40_012430 [Ordospora colligata]|nr:hypothetical protein CWI40_012430 [Ordospora colligata]
MSSTGKKLRNAIGGIVFGAAFTLTALYFLRIFSAYQQRSHNCQVFFEYFGKFRDVKKGIENKDVFDAIESIIDFDGNTLEGMYSEKMVSVGEVDSSNNRGFNCFKGAIAKAKQIIFSSQDLKKVMDEILTSERVSVLIAKERMQKEGEKEDDESKTEDSSKADEDSNVMEIDAKNIDILTKAFLYILVKESMNPKSYESFFDHLMNDNVTKNHLSKISKSKDLLTIDINIKGVGDDSPISIYNFIRIVMLETNNLIPRIISDFK